MLALGRLAKAASRAVREASTQAKNKALLGAAAAIRAHGREILAANVQDMSESRAAGLAPALLDRLALDGQRIEAMAKAVEDIAALGDPVGRELARWKMPNGLDIARVSTPIGVIAMIYESRPNVTADAGALALKAGNVTILRCGSESMRSSAAIHAAMLEGLRAAGLPEAAICRVTTPDRAAVGLLLCGLDHMVDLIIPRGGKGLTDRVMAEARVPVLAHLEGVCHVYVHQKADLAKARAIVVNAKMRRSERS